MLPLTKEELKSYQDAKLLYLWKKIPKKSLLMIKIMEKVDTIVIVQVNIEVPHIEFVI